MRFIIPNYHVILIHFPLALLGVGLLIEIVTLLIKRVSLRESGRWMIFLGVLAMAPAATSGIAALLDIMSQGQEQAGSWNDLKTGSSFTATDWHLVRDHVLMTCIASGIALALVVSWVGASDVWRKRTYAITLLGLLATMGLLAAGAWHGGEMIYHEGFGVTGLKAVVPADDTPPPTDWQSKLDDYFPTGQMHLIFAGLLVSAAAAAIAFSLRRAAVVTEKLPSPSLWLLAALVAILVIFSGLYFGDYLVWPRVLNIPNLKRTVHEIFTPEKRRKAFHIVFGGSILVLMLLLAILARWAPKQRILLASISALLTLTVAAQFWVGILLLYDGTEGPLKRFTP